MSSILSRVAQAVRSAPVAATAGALLAAVLVWTYLPILEPMAHRWGHDSRYSHGYLVPIFALFLLWWRRELAPPGLGPNGWGLLLLLAGLAANAAGTYLYFDFLNALGMVVCLAGLTVLVAGWPGLRWAWASLAFLMFMVPLPYAAETALAGPLQRVATFASTYALQTLGFAAFAEGNVIRMGQVRVGVVEACSGLSMLMIFFALCTAVAVLVRRPLLERLLIVASAVPIAVLANVTRITVTGVLHKLTSKELADLVFHDLAGWLMMPLALAMLWVEMRLYSWVVRTPTAEDEQPAFPVDFLAGHRGKVERRRDKADEAPLDFGPVYMPPPGPAATVPAENGPPR
jgi:exosortase